MACQRSTSAVCYVLTRDGCYVVNYLDFIGVASPNKALQDYETCGLHVKAPAKRSQHFNATYRNIAGCNMLRTFGHAIATCCDMLGVVGSNLKKVKFFMQHLCVA